MFKQLNVLLQTGALNPTSRIVLSIRRFVGIPQFLPHLLNTHAHQSFRRPGPSVDDDELMMTQMINHQ